MNSISPARLYEDQKEELHLELLSRLARLAARDHRERHQPPRHGADGLRRELPARAHPDPGADGARLPGHAARSRPCARRWTGCLRLLDAPDRRLQGARAAARTCSSAPTECQVPVLRTHESTTPFIHLLTSYLDHMFAPSTTVHGSLVDVYGCGLLFTGRSGIGKSETALDLVERGHRLVADDVVTMTRRQRRRADRQRQPAPAAPHGDPRRSASSTCSPSSASARSACRSGSRSRCDLQEWSDEESYERIGLDERTTEILGVADPAGRGADLPGQEHHGDRRGASRSTTWSRSTAATRPPSASTGT